MDNLFSDDTITFYTVYGHVDTTEGLRGMMPVIRFYRHEDALAFIEQPKFYEYYGIMGMKMKPEQCIRRESIDIYAAPQEFRP
jgi:hypothetical protein